MRTANFHASLALVHCYSAEIPGKSIRKKQSGRRVAGRHDGRRKCWRVAGILEVDVLLKYVLEFFIFFKGKKKRKEKCIKKKKKK